MKSRNRTDDRKKDLLAKCLNEAIIHACSNCEHICSTSLCGMVMRWRMALRESGYKPEN